MGQNGVSHQVVADDLEGVKAVLAWLAYAPAHTGAAPPPLPTSDPIGRTVGYVAPDGVSRARSDIRLSIDVVFHKTSM